MNDAIVIGAGPAGLAVGACLNRAGLRPLVIDRADRVGSSWHGHYDRLALHTVKGRSGLPHRSMGAKVARYPKRSEVIAYLEDYVAAEGLELALGREVTAVRPGGPEGWLVETADEQHAARRVVFATGLNSIPNRPDWPGLAEFPGPILHSSEYRAPAALSGRRVLVVGFGNSGGDIALDLAEAGRAVTLSVRGPINILPKELLGIPITSMGLLRKLLPYRLVDRLTAPLLRAKIGSPEDFGLKQASKGPAAQVIEDGRIPLIDIGALDAIRAGQIAVAPGIDRFEGGEAVFTDGSRAEFDAVVCATGYRVDLRVLLPDTPEVLDSEGRPRLSGGPSGAPGLYFCSYKASADGQLRQICAEARAIASAAAAPPHVAVQKAS